jgi:uncharacterized protein DUF2278
MPLSHYGVAIGTLQSFTRDPQHQYGSWYHGHLSLATPSGTWQSALDVDAPQAVGVAYRIVGDLTTSDLGPLAAMTPGFHELAHTGASGALDYVRSPSLRDGLVIRWARRASLIRRSRIPWSPPPPDVGLPGGADPAGYGPPPFGPDIVDLVLQRALVIAQRALTALLSRIPYLGWRWRSFPWIASNGDNALDALDPYVRSAQRIYVLGQRYEDGTNGVHDVHMNQGDPAGSQWYASNGTWQDGAVACESAGSRVTVWQVRFQTQSLNTDEQGHPR